MITKEQALIAYEFHYGTCHRSVGPRGGITEQIERWRRNGRTKTWVRQPQSWEIPVKYGLKHYSTIRDWDQDSWHLETDCPLRNLCEGASSEKNIDGKQFCSKCEKEI